MYYLYKYHASAVNKRGDVATLQETISASFCWEIPDLVGALFVWNRPIYHRTNDPIPPSLLSYCGWNIVPALADLSQDQWPHKTHTLAASTGKTFFLALADLSQDWWPHTTSILSYCKWNNIVPAPADLSQDQWPPYHLHYY